MNSALHRGMLLKYQVRAQRSGSDLERKNNTDRSWCCICGAALDPRGYFDWTFGKFQLKKVASSLRAKISTQVMIAAGVAGTEFDNKM